MAGAVSDVGIRDQLADEWCVEIQARTEVLEALVAMELRVLRALARGANQVRNGSEIERVQDYLRSIGAA